MEKGTYEKILINLKYTRNEWREFDEISSIVLNDGRGIYPNWQYMRFLIKDNGDILIKHGKSEPYGARLIGSFMVSYDGFSISFPKGDIISPTEYYTKFRFPVEGDIIRLSDKKLLGEFLVSKVSVRMNAIIINLANPLYYKNRGRLSFYDPNSFDSELCMHSTAVEGVYMKFKENSGKPDKKYGVYHEIIKYKDIKEISLKVGSNGLSTYKLD